MKVVYFSKCFFADCDFPLVRELQRKGVDVRYYIPIAKGFKGSSILEFKQPWNKWGVYKASTIKDLQLYKDCIDLNRLYFISGYTNKRWSVVSWLLWVYAMFHILFQRADVWHITWQLEKYENYLLYVPFKKKKVMTVHDPIQHSGAKNSKLNEERRLKSFNWVDDFILLNSHQASSFCEMYHIDKKRIHLSHLGVYDSISYLNIKEVAHPTPPYIVFFGLIAPYKGVEYLLDAMIKVHSIYPDVKLLIAGKGKLYFDYSKYEQLDYIVMENRYVSVSELVSYIRNSLFSVCPYRDATQSGVIQTSFALDCPVIATSVGDFQETVKNGVYGLIVPPCDTDSLSQAICELIKDNGQLQKMKERIRNEWKPSMSWDSVAEDYLAVYGK